MCHGPRADRPCGCTCTPWRATTCTRAFWISACALPPLCAEHVRLRRPRRLGFAMSRTKAAEGTSQSRSGREAGEDAPSDRGRASFGETEVVPIGPADDYTGGEEGSAATCHDESQMQASDQKPVVTRKYYYNETDLHDYTGCGCHCEGCNCVETLKCQRCFCFSKKCLKHNCCEIASFKLVQHDENVRIPLNIPSLPHGPEYTGGRQARILYEAEMAERFRWLGLTCPACSMPMIFFVFFCWPLFLAVTAIPARSSFFTATWVHICCHLDQICCFKSKGYHQRTYLYVKENGIEFNYPVCRFPWNCFGCGSWNQDAVRVHHFDRGAFGFRKLHCGSVYHALFFWSCFGEVMGRQRCPWSGPCWRKSEWTGRYGCCCDCWLCSLCGCNWHYGGLANAEEVSAAADVALQAYFDNVKLTHEQYDKLLDDELARRGLPPRQSWICRPHHAREKMAAASDEIQAPPVQSMKV
eukprot:scaffold236_cov419-Prasinococcus_capsulatus_cf.AAC.25